MGREVPLHDLEPATLSALSLVHGRNPNDSIYMRQLVSGHAYLLGIEGPRFQFYQPASKENWDIIRTGVGCWEAKTIPTCPQHQFLLRHLHQQIYRNGRCA